MYITIRTIFFLMVLLISIFSPEHPVYSQTPACISKANAQANIDPANPAANLCLFIFEGIVYNVPKDKNNTHKGVQMCGYDVPSLPCDPANPACLPKSHQNDLTYKLGTYFNATTLYKTLCPPVTDTPTPTQTPIPTNTPTVVPPSATPVIPSVSPLCPLKPYGDADCNGKVDIVDFEIWRREKFAVGGCSSTNLSGCGVDEDSDGSAMDANFNYPHSGAFITDILIDKIDFEIFRKRYTSQI